MKIRLWDTICKRMKGLKQKKKKKLDKNALEL